jgi:hypothetical protein
MWIAGAGVVLVIFTSARIYIFTQPFFHLLSALTVLYLLGIGIQGIERSRPYAWTFVVTALVLATWMAAEWPLYYGIPKSDTWLEPIPFMAILCGLVVNHRSESLPSSAPFGCGANQDLIAQGGRGGTTAAIPLPQYHPQIAVFEPDSPTVDLVLQISNFHENWSGLVRTVRHVKTGCCGKRPHAEALGECDRRIDAPGSSESISFLPAPLSAALSGGWLFSWLGR